MKGERTMLDYIRLLVDYTYWAHRRVWAGCILPLTEAQFLQPLSYSVGSIRNQLVHTMSAEWMWHMRLTGSSPKTLFAPEDFPTREAIRLRWDAVEVELRAYVDGLTEDSARQVVTYQTTTGRDDRQQVMHVLLHVVNHGTDHRAQTLAMLHTLGAPTIDQDLLVYLRQQPGGGTDVAR